MHTPWL